jgi:hypothetical protein
MRHTMDEQAAQNCTLYNNCQKIYNKWQIYTLLGSMSTKRCQRCGETFSAPSKLQRHLRRKTSCAPVLDREPEVQDDDRQHMCRFCGRRFTHQSGVSQHIRKNCKIANSTDGLDKLAEHTERRQIRELQDQVRQLTALVKGTQLAPLANELALPTTTNIQGSTIIGTQNVYTLNLFGQESVKHLTPERIRAILASAAQGLPEGSGKRLQEHEKPAPPVLKAVETASRAVLQALIAEVYANTACPENLTAYIPNKKEDQVMIWAKPTEETEPCWQLRPLEQLVPTIQGKVLDALNDNQPWDSNKEKLREYGLLIRGSYDYSPQGFARLIKGVLLGNKTLLGSLGIQA